MAVSSAKITMESEGKTEGKSLIKAENREGPNTEPWGTPEVEKPGDEKESLTRVIWQQSERYDSN